MRVCSEVTIFARSSRPSQSVESTGQLVPEGKALGSREVDVNRSQSAKVDGENFSADTP
jgi:hypothetical protein